jgi:diacylglycerol O-acyltransferase
VRAALANGLCRTPRLRQVVRRTLPGQGRAVWTEVEVDLDWHLRVVPVPAPGDETACLRCCEGVLTPVMERRRPLWDFMLLPGFSGGRVGIVLRLHHALADGIAAVRLIQAMFDGPLAVLEAPSGMTRAPNGRELAVDAWRVRLAAAKAAMFRTHRAGGLMTSPGTLASQVRALAHPSEPVPRTSLHRPVGPARRLAALRIPFEPVHAVAHANGASVNDAVLAASQVGSARCLPPAESPLM